MAGKSVLYDIEQSGAQGRAMLAIDLSLEFYANPEAALQHAAATAV